MDTAHLDSASGSLSWPMVLHILRPIRDNMASAAEETATLPPANLLDWARVFLPAHFAVPPSSMHHWLADSLYTLMCMRAESGRTAFEREKQNSPIDPEACEWPETYFGEHLWFDEWPQKLRLKILALDPSKGADARRGDFSAFVRLGIDAQGILYVEADLARRPTPQIVADGVANYHQFQPDAFGIEANQFQELLGDQFVIEFRRQGLLSVQPCLIENKVNKLVRIRRLGPLLSSRRFRMKAGSPGTQLLVDQLKQFPVADHDDGPDALEMALQLAAQLLHARSFNDGLGHRLPVGR